MQVVKFFCVSPIETEQNKKRMMNHQIWIQLRAREENNSKHYKINFRFGVERLSSCVLFICSEYSVNSCDLIDKEQVNWL